MTKGYGNFSAVLINLRPDGRMCCTFSYRVEYVRFIGTHAECDEIIAEEV